MAPFALSVANERTPILKPKEPLALYFYINTKPGSIYMPMDIEIIMPETSLGSGVPAGSLCLVEVDFVGIYSSCAQKEVINDPESSKITYLQR
jgi:hypothetical protein